MHNSANIELEACTLKTKALKGDNGEMPGSYKLVTTLLQQVINPGDDIRIDQYITGYGKAKNLKLSYFPSSEIFNYDESIIKYGLGNPIEGLQVWGGIEQRPEAYGCVIDLGIYRNDRWPEPSFFFDMHPQLPLSTQIGTEVNLGGNPPFYYKFKTRKNVKPGTYKISFFLTYFDDESWQTTEQQVEFKVNSIFERYSTALSALAAAALIVTIIHDGIQPLIEAVIESTKAIHELASCAAVNTTILHCL